MDNNSKLSSIVNNLNSTQIDIYMAITVYHIKDQLYMFFYPVICLVAQGCSVLDNI